MTVTIQAQGLEKRFGKTAALAGLDLVADSGQVTAQRMIPPVASQRRVNPATALAAAGVFPLPIAMARAPRLRASPVIRFSSASVASVSAMRR